MCTGPMRIVDQFTEENTLYAGRLRAAVAPEYGGHTMWGLIKAIKPTTQVQAGFIDPEDAVFLTRHANGRWALVTFTFPWEDRSSRFRQWSEHTENGRIDLSFTSYLKRLEAETLPDLFEVMAAGVRRDDLGTPAHPSAPLRALFLVLASGHPDAEPVRLFWGLDGYIDLKDSMASEGIEVTAEGVIVFEGGHPINPAETGRS